MTERHVIDLESDFPVFDFGRTMRDPDTSSTESSEAGATVRSERTSRDVRAQFVQVSPRYNVHSEIKDDTASSPYSLYLGRAH
eukprot:2601073-Rhodomonas_salina.2